MINNSEYYKDIKIKELITINGCSAINNIKDAHLLLDDNGNGTIIIDNIDDKLKGIVEVYRCHKQLPNGIFTTPNNENVRFRAKDVWLDCTEERLNIFVIL